MLPLAHGALFRDYVARRAGISFLLRVEVRDLAETLDEALEEDGQSVGDVVPHHRRGAARESEVDRQHQMRVQDHVLMGERRDESLEHADVGRFGDGPQQGHSRCHVDYGRPGTLQCRARVSADTGEGWEREMPTAVCSHL